MKKGVTPGENDGRIGLSLIQFQSCLLTICYFMELFYRHELSLLPKYYQNYCLTFEYILPMNVY